MKWIVATPSRDLSSHRTKELAFKKALQYIRRGIGRRNMDVYKVVSEQPVAPDAGIGYRIDETWDVRIRDGDVVAQRYRGDGSSVGRPVILGSL
jgi:hypothetical protein